MKTLLRSQARRRQRGATAVEFALVSTVFFTLLIGMMEMGRVLFYWNTAAEATRLGARIAAVCDVADANIKAKMTDMLSLLPASAISVAYDPSGCDINTCRYVTVKVQSVTVATLIPLMPLNLAMPDFSTTLPRESLQSTVGGTANPMCN
jgi:Flp pilus assembly protein TadG